MLSIGRCVCVHILMFVLTKKCGVCCFYRLYRLMEKNEEKIVREKRRESSYYGPTYFGKDNAVLNYVIGKGSKEV